MLETDLLISQLGEVKLLNKEEILVHLHKYYGLSMSDITKDSRILKYIEMYANNKSIFNGINTFDKSYGREEFNKSVKKEYKKLSNKYFADCEISGFFPKEDVSHTFPIIYGGSNSFHNLHFISHEMHEILHMNPLEHKEEYCFISIDHLITFARNKFYWLEARQRADYDRELAYRLWINKIKDKMTDVYIMFNKIEKYE